MKTAVAPLEPLFEREGLLRRRLPAELEHGYGGGLGFPTPRVYANFVSTLDGVVALPGLAHSSQTIAGHSEADRFVMGLLRAFADVVLIGAGTLRGAPDSLWTPAFIWPHAEDAFAELRRELGRAAEPRLAVLTGRGDLDPAHPALEAGALVLTTAPGASRLARRLPQASSVLVLGGGPSIDLGGALAALRSEGHDLVLSEGGPSVIGGLLETGLLDELFLTLSPVLAGRPGPDRRPGAMDGARPGLVEGVELLPGREVRGEIASIRRHGSHLFLRYLLR